MAKFRLVHTSFWNDPTVSEEMTPEDKYFFLYLLTNEHTTQVGIYGITRKQIAFELGYSMESINALMQRFIDHHKLIKYNAETREIAIKNWGKYNFNKGGKPVLDCVRSELKNVKDQSLILYVSRQIHNESIKCIYDSYHVTCNDTSTIRTTISGQEEEKEEEEQEEKEEEKEQQQQEGSRSSVSSLNISNFGSLAIFYEKNIGPLLPVISQELGLLYDNFEDVELIQEAFKIAIQVNAKNKMRYADGILRNWKAELITSYEQLKSKEARDKNAGIQRRVESNGNEHSVDLGF